MCGIAGHWGIAAPDADRIRSTVSQMMQRGPDHQEAEVYRLGPQLSCTFIHSRLSIIDLDPRSNQPMTIDRKTIIFNGELYNYKEIRAELSSRGIECETNSDTEVLLRAIDAFGFEVLDRCEGMWAFAYLDHRRRRLTICRDRFGEKPLYVHRNGNGITFGSEIKFLRSLTGASLSVSESQLLRYLVNGYKSLYKQEKPTFFADIEEVAPGTVWHLDELGEVHVQRYWEPKCDIHEEMSYQDAVAGVRERLLRSVELRLRADVPIAFCMSGGIDSNTLISIAKRVFGYDVHGFTVGNVDARYDEREIVEATVKELGIRHTTIPVDPTNFLENLRNVVAYHDAPVFTISYYAHWLLMRSVAQHGYKISVSGTAADELFTGYYDHHFFYMAEIQKDAELLERTKGAWETRIKPNVQNPLLRDPMRLIQNPTLRDHIYLDAEEFRKRLARPWNAEHFSEKKFTSHILRNRMLNELMHEAIPVILHEDDSNAMYFSIENRSPFLDRELCDFCFSIPTRHLMRDAYTKVVLRDAMRGIVPDFVLDNHRKVGFNAPILDFLSMSDPNVRRIVFEPSPIFDYLDRNAINKVFEIGKLCNNESKFLFNFLSAKFFLEKFSGATAERAAA